MTIVGSSNLFFAPVTLPPTGLDSKCYSQSSAAFDHFCWASRELFTEFSTSDAVSPLRHERTMALQVKHIDEGSSGCTKGTKDVFGRCFGHLFGSRRFLLHNGHLLVGSALPAGCEREPATLPPPSPPPASPEATVLMINNLGVRGNACRCTYSNSQRRRVAKHLASGRAPTLKTPLAFS